MNETLNNILIRLADFSELNQKQRKSVQNDLIEFASEHTEKFEETIRAIEPSEKSILFEVYESLSAQPEIWISFIISEFDRIQILTEKAKSKHKDSISYPLIAISFFARKKFEGNEKLISKIKKGTSSKSKQIVKISIDLLADIYVVDRTRNISCRQIIERLAKSQTTEINQLAKEILYDFDNSKQSKKFLKYFSAYAFIIFIGGLILTLVTISYFNKTFVDFSAILMAFFMSSLLAWILHQIVIKNRSVKKSEMFSVVFGYGLIGCFLLLFINQQFTEEKIKHEEYKIIDWGTLSKGRYSDCRQPYVKFNRKGKEKQMKFFCHELEIVEKAQKIDLTIKKGLLGFDIVIAKELKTTGANRVGG